MLHSLTAALVRWRKLDGKDKRWVATCTMIGGAVVFAFVVFLVPPSRMTDPAVKLLTSMVWPFVLLLTVVLFRPQVESLISEVTERIHGGADLTIANFMELKSGTVSEKAARIPAPTGEESITLKNVALLHTSFIPTRKPAFSDGLTYLQIEIIVIAPDAVMERIASVTYRFDDAYPPKNREQVRTDRRDRFKAKELANGTSIVQAEIKFLDQEAPLQLNRFIDLRPDGPRI